MKKILIIIAEVIEFFDYFVQLEGQRNQKYTPYNFGWLRRKWGVQ